MAAAFLNPKGYGDGAIAGPCSAGVGSSGGGGAELDNGVSLHVTGVFPPPKPRPDRSPTRDLIPIAGHGILAERGASP